MWPSIKTRGPPAPSVVATTVSPRAGPPSSEIGVERSTAHPDARNLASQTSAMWSTPSRLNDPQSTFTIRSSAATNASRRASRRSRIASAPMGSDASMPLVAGGELNRWWRGGLPIVAPLVRILFRVRVVGVEHVPSTGPAILAFNHVSALDGPVLAIELARHIKRESRFLVAAEFFRRRLVGWVLRRAE